MQDVHIGPFPPPLGGISVGMYRLSKIEKDAYFINHKIHKILHLKFYFQLIKQMINFKKKNFILHSHNLNIRLLLYFFSCISYHEFSLVIRGRSLIIQYNKSIKLIKIFIKKMLERATFIQLVNPEYTDFMNNLGIKNKNVFVKYGYLPPPLEEESKILKTYESELLDFVQTRDPIIVSNASMIQFYKNEDLYGIDICIDLTNRLKQDFPNIGFLFALANEKKNSNYFKKMQEKVRKLDINSNFYFMIGQKEIWPLFKIADLVIRATNVDGDSVSIREALYFKTPIVASDVTFRPEGCFLFRNRDIEDLYKNCKIVLSKKTKSQSINRG